MIVQADPPVKPLDLLVTAVPARPHDDAVVVDGLHRAQTDGTVGYLERVELGAERGHTSRLRAAARPAYRETTRTTKVTDATRAPNSAPMPNQFRSCTSCTRVGTRND